MKKLLELEAKLRKAKAELEKNALMGYGNDAATGMPAGAAGSGDVNMVKEEHDDEKEDKELIAEAMDEHNEKKHGEPKKKDSAYKDMKVKKNQDYVVKFEKNGQWKMVKADTMDMKPNGEFDVPVKEVYDGDDEFVHVGNRSVDGSDKGKTQKLADTEKKLLNKAAPEGVSEDKYKRCKEEVKSEDMKDGKKDKNEYAICAASLQSKK